MGVNNGRPAKTIIHQACRNRTYPGPSVSQKLIQSTRVCLSVHCSNENSNLTTTMTTWYLCRIIMPGPYSPVIDHIHKNTDCLDHFCPLPFAISSIFIYIDQSINWTNTHSYNIFKIYDCVLSLSLRTFMGILPDLKEIMEASLSSSSTTKVERRVIEKNRRNHMKILYAHLNSLLPNQNSKVHRSHPFPYICSLYADCLHELGFQLHSN